MRLREHAGQAAADYVAVLAVVAVALATVAAVAVPGVGERVVGTVRTGLCIVGGDICRDADAVAAGLAPCVVADRFQRTGTTLDIAVVRLGDEREWQLAVRSDGTATVTRLEESAGGATAGVGVTFSPAGLEADLSAAALAVYRSGRAWAFPDLAAARAFLARVADEPLFALEPDVRWDAVGGDVEAGAGVAFRELAAAGLSVQAGAALGLRREGARRTLALTVASAGPGVFADLPGVPYRHASERSAVAELSWERGALRTLVLRQPVATAADRVEEWTATLPLATPSARDAARGLLLPGGAGMPAVVRLIRSEGSIERSVYATHEDSSTFGAAAKLGLALGIDHERSSGGRELVSATTWVRGGPAQQRFDCLGV